MKNFAMKNKNLTVNHLKGQTSPYLLQHLHNPVDWYPWGEEALGKASRENKPLLVSIGYSACHWCHVMEKESFEDEEIAEIMNRNFICIKVDREERPDIDHLYMTAVQLLTMRGGWPLNCFALPDGRPFWGGTYFPRDQWKEVLLQVIELYQARSDELIEQAEKLTTGVVNSSFIKPDESEKSLKKGDADQVFNNIMKHMDSLMGGTSGAPKFPLPVNLEFLLHYHYKRGDSSALEQVDISLEGMAMGGIFDQIGGGFARYSTDEFWKVPHFEKMLYDNGQLISLYSNAWKLLKKQLFRDVVYRTVEFADRELGSPDGAYYSALDADSEGEEGKFYLWEEKEIDELLGKDSRLVKDYYQVGKKGLWEDGKNILLRDESDEIFARKNNLDPEDVRKIIRHANQKLLQERLKRPRPGLDNKILTSWNSLMIKGLADAYAAFGDGSFLQKSEKAAGFILDNSVTEGRVFRMPRGSGPRIDGFLEDYALLINSLIRLYEVSAKPRYLLKARELTEYTLENFSAPVTNLLRFSTVSAESLKSEYYEIPDNVIPSSNSVMAANLLYLSHLFERGQWERLSFRMLRDVSSQMVEQSTSFANWGRLLLNYVFPFYNLVVCGTEADRRIRDINTLYLPDALVAGSLHENNEIPVFAGRCKAGETWYYACTLGSCKMPVRDLSLALDQIRNNR